MTNPKEYVLHILRNARGDDLERTERAFKGWPLELMNKPYGPSEQTPNQLLASYRQRAADLDAAIKWVESI